MHSEKLLKSQLEGYNVLGKALRVEERLCMPVPDANTKTKYEPPHHRRDSAVKSINELVKPKQSTCSHSVISKLTTF
jgi:hypothetical protein